jgi:hypothetical protein
VADGWCWFVLREEYCWLVAGGWFVVREKYCWLVADKPSEQGEPDISFRAPLVRGAPPLAMAAFRAELLHGATPAPTLASRWHPSPMPRLVELLHHGVLLHLSVVPSSTTSSAPSSRRIELLHHGGLLHAYIAASVFRCGPSGAGLDRIDQL